MKKFSVIIFLSIVVAQFTLSATAADPPEITADSARNLAQAYYLQHFGACGGVGSVIQRGDYWIAPVHYGRAGTFRGYVGVHRQTGAIVYGLGTNESARGLDRWFASVNKQPLAP